MHFIYRYPCRFCIYTHGWLYLSCVLNVSRISMAVMYRCDAIFCSWKELLARRHALPCIRMFWTRRWIEAAGRSSRMRNWCSWWISINTRTGRSSPNNLGYENLLSASQSPSQLVTQSVSWSPSQSVGHPVSWPPSQSVGHPVSQLVTQSVSWSPSQSVGHPVSRSPF